MTALRLLLAALAAGAYVEVLYPLQQVLDESEVIAEGVIEKVDKENHLAFIRIGKSLKGACSYALIRMNFSGGQTFHPDAIRKHLVVGAPAILFYNAGRQAEVYLNRFFFQLYGDAAAAPDKAWWTFTHIEVRMNRTFNGPAPELAELLPKILAGKAKPPEPDGALPAMDAASLKALPGPLEPVADEAALPAPFLRRPRKPSVPREPENPAKSVPGLAFDYYEGQWMSIPDLAPLKPAKSGGAAEFSVAPRARETQFALRFRGFIEVPRDGAWTFFTASNDGSKLWIGDREVVSNDHHHGVVEKSGDILLKAGRHAVSVVYFQEGGETVLDVFWEGPGTARQKIPPAALSRAP